MQQLNSPSGFGVDDYGIMTCKICGHETFRFAKAKLLDKYDVQYFRCQNCGFIQTEEPYWLNDAYASAITDSDLGLVGRNISVAIISKAVIVSFFDANAKFLDFGGGYGMLVRLMRDGGFDFYRHDELCVNLFARGFDADVKGSNHFELVTAFEVFEHLANPLKDIEKMLEFSRSVLFSTILMPPSKPRPDEWWYYGLDHGQHIAFYTFDALSQIAQRFHLNLYSNGTSLHLLTPLRIPSFWFRTVSRRKFAQCLAVLVRKRPSLLPADYFRITGKYLT